jgi:hypothetical protein
LPRRSSLNKSIYRIQRLEQLKLLERLELRSIKAPIVAVVSKVPIGIKE